MLWHRTEIKTKTRSVRIANAHSHVTCHLFRFGFDHLNLLSALFISLNNFLLLNLVLSDQHFRTANVTGHWRDGSSTVDQLRFDLRRVLVVVDHRVKKAACLIDFRKILLMNFDKFIDDLLFLAVGFTAHAELFSCSQTIFHLSSCFLETFSCGSNRSECFLTWTRLANSLSKRWYLSTSSTVELVFGTIFNSNRWTFSIV